ncbi:MAG: PAS domain S-box protein [Candidatus Bathyarchaeia archaeon]|jgi:PAS domain S-box-containing protein
MAKEANSLRRFGVELVDAIPWGTHLCQFYDSKQDLIDILVPYFAEGLRSNEFCMWVTSLPLEVEEAKKALQAQVPDLDEFIKKGQIEIISYDQWYLIDGKFDSAKVLQGWVEKEQNALKRGFDGLRLTGNTLWVERSLWNSFVDYEEAINSVIGNQHMIALCTYCLKNCSGADVLDVVRNHIGTLVKQDQKWYLLEDSTRRREVNGALTVSEQKYKVLFKNMIDGFAYHKVIFDDEGKPVDYVFLEVNEAFERLTGLKADAIIGKKVTQILPGIENDPTDWIGVYGKVASTGETLKFESFNQALNKWFSVSAFSPAKGYFVATFEDITERKKAEKALKESEERWATTVSSIGDAIITTDLNAKILFLNKVAESLTGWTQQEAWQKPIEKVFNIINQFTRQETKNPVSQVIKEGVIAGLANHTLLVRKDGSEVPIDDSGAPVKDKEGNIIGVVLVFRDITERKKAEETLIKSEKRLKLSQEIAHLGSWELDLKNNKLTWTDEVYRIFGLKPQEFVATYEAFLETVHPNDRTTVDAAYTNSLKEGRDKYEIEHRVVRKSTGEIRVVQEKCEHIRDESGKVIRSVGMVQDVTDRKKAENELNEVRFYLQNLLNYANAPIIVWDKEFRITLFNHAFERLTGLKAKDVLEKPLEMLFPEARKHESMGHIKRTLEGEYWETVEIPILTKDGNVRTVLWNSANIYDSNGKNVISTIAQGNDITERKQFEQALERAKVDWERTFNSVPDLIAILDDKHRIVRANKAMAQALGTNPEKCIGLKCFECVHGQCEPPDLCPHTLAMMDGQEHTTEVHEKRLDGDFIVSATPLKDEHGHILGSVHVARNITLRKQMESKLEEYSKQLERLVEERTKQLRDSERLATIGATAGMVGHDIRNPLQAIASSLYLTKTDLEDVPESKNKEAILESITEIEKNIDYINKIVADLQDFAKPLKPILSNIDLSAIVQDVIKSRVVPNNISVENIVDPQANCFVSDATYIRRILSNLVNNAVQAMPDGGKLTIKASCEKDTVVIKVQDTGLGIAEEAKGKLFTPLFTTKSKGQGFGLAVVKRMSEALGGSVSFESKTGKGTTFTVRLPLKR